MKVKTVGTISEFMNPEPKQKKRISSVLLPVALAGGATPAFAQEAIQVSISTSVKERIISSFDPLIELITALSYPVAGVMVTGGALMIMIGMKEKGYSTLQTASLGYILVQLSPLMLDLLVGIGDAV